MSVPATTQAARSAVPSPGLYEIDPAHTTVGFVARHLVFTRVRGRFEDFSGTIEVASLPEQSKVTATISAAGIDTASPQRDEHLRSPDFLDAGRYPNLSFVSTAIEPAGDAWLVHGDLTIKGVTRPVTLSTEFLGSAGDPWGGERISFSAAARIDRTAFGLTWNQALETGGVLVGNDVDIEIEAQAVRK